MNLLIKVAGRTFGKQGYMGYGIAAYDRHRLLFHESHTIKEKNKNREVATCIAITKAVEWAKSQQFTDLIIASDNEALVNALKGGTQSHNSKEYQYLTDVIRKLPFKITFQWTTVKKNKMADALALKAVGTPNALIHIDGRIEYWKNQDIPMHIKGIPDTPKEIKLKIIDMNKRTNFSYKDCLGLEVKENDPFNTLKQKKLKEYICLRYGKDLAEYIEAVLETAHEGYRVSSYKWIARGLNPNAAFKRTSIEMEEFGQIK